MSRLPSPPLSRRALFGLGPSCRDPTDPSPPIREALHSWQAAAIAAQTALEALEDLEASLWRRDVPVPRYREQLRQAEAACRLASQGLDAAAQALFAAEVRGIGDLAVKLAVLTRQGALVGETSSFPWPALVQIERDARLLAGPGRKGDAPVADPIE